MGDPAVRPVTSALPFWQIGSDGGFLPAPVSLQTLVLGVAERADVIIDFTGVPVAPMSSSSTRASTKASTLTIRPRSPRRPGKS